MIHLSDNRHLDSTSFEDQLQPLFSTLKNLDKRPLTLNIKTSQIALLSAQAANLGYLPFLILNQKPRQIEFLQSHLQSLTKQLNDTTTWHIFSGQLTDHEKSGLVVSSLSQTNHAFLQGQKKHAYLLASDQLTTPIPNPNPYRSSALSLHVNQKITQQDLIQKLIKLGYQRNTTSLEPGSFLVQGEHLRLLSILSPSSISITWFGSNLETIVQDQLKQTINLSDLKIYPNSFPTDTALITNFLDDYLVITTFDNQLKHHRQIITDSLNPEQSFPISEQACPALSSPDLKPISLAHASTLIAELTPGRPAIHTDHGLGLFEGLETRTLDGTPREYLVLRYADDGVLSIPVEYAHKVTAYLGDSVPPLNKLGGTTWIKAKAQAQVDAEAFAQDLIETARQRSLKSGHRHTIDSDLEVRLDSSFNFELTPDQASAWEAIKFDLESDQPLDRLIVGDVGFGKTEIAIRTAAQLVANGFQVAVLAPTTLLVQQHTDTFQQRLTHLSKNITQLSRFISPKKIKQAREHIQSGQAQIAIGTHALLSAATRWKNLGLVIIDEEQRFGVKHKEHFKKLRADLDVLSLSATPIPRTLSMSLQGLKELSVISTAPAGRKDVITKVTRETDRILKTAIQQELNRSGQVYLVAPKIRQLSSLALRTQELFPNARLAIVHGRLPADQLADIMHKFDQHELDILVASSIIENGLDLPNANTLIVTHATHFGLSDLYQLRGRVGRRHKQGFAYFLFSQHKLTTDQKQRLAALTEASRLGSGWSLAQRDLEIRGAGNLLGASQSGTVNAIGIQLYLDLINQAVAKHNQVKLNPKDVDIGLPISALIPTSYINHASQRTRAYQELSRAQNLDQLNQIFNNLVKNHGPAPEEFSNLKLLITLQHVAAQAKLTRITFQPVTPHDEPAYHRLIVQAKKLPKALHKLNQLGNWRVTDDIATHDLDQIDSAFIQKLITVLN